jgi:hypothetical protein
MRRRLFPPTSVDYTRLYRCNMSMTDHVYRTMVTGAVLASMKPTTLLDPACGDGTVIQAAYNLHKFDKASLSDLSVVNINRLDVNFPYSAQVDNLMDAIAKTDPVDVIVLTEILEHLEDPDEVLRLARTKAKRVLVSSPLEEPEHSNNHEHLWSFDREGYAEMLMDAGWTPFGYTEIGFTDPRLYYKFQIWVAE